MRPGSRKWLPLLLILTRQALALRPSLVRATAPRCRPALLRAPEYVFDLDKEKQSIRFGCRQRTLTMVRPEQRGPLAEFVESDPVGICLSSWGPGKVQPAENGAEGQFVIRVDDFDFVMLKLGVDLTAEVWLDSSTSPGTARLESKGFKLVGPGLDDIAEMIDIRVSGRMRPSPADSALSSLTGDVAFEASGQLPPLLQGVPESVLRAAARLVSESLISAAADRFSKAVPASYSKWGREARATTG